MSELNKEVLDLVWGRPSSGGVSASIFRRWTQGFVFSENEHTALEQFEGGPCAVIAPVQEEQKTELCSTLNEILESACASPTTGFCLVTWAKGQSPHASVHTKSQTESQSQTQDMPAPESSQPPQEQQPSDLKTVIFGDFFPQGIENIRNEIQDTMEPLIDPVHGHGSQSLVNLLVTGHAVSNVWDGDRECSGMKLHGIHKQASVGFLTLMESLRYCKVGSFLKSPKFPIWILGSETHLSVFFTKDMCLVGPESPTEQARRVFQSFDPEDNGFIPESLLEDVMKALDLVSEPEYVNLVKSKLDPESLGIILLGPFLLEFFPDQDSGIPDSLPVYHYNGLKQSNHNERVEYVEGTALVLGFEDPMVRTDDTPVKRCLQTKWPYIELLWSTDRSPSLN
uniref:Ubiquitin carboxyl-terminal hydrolase MINDY n=1 Tax=Takifugu rubripes TaxID=31033 RepID=A0A674MT42_TAKRU